MEFFFKGRDTETLIALSVLASKIASLKNCLSYNQMRDAVPIPKN